MGAPIMLLDLEEIEAMMANRQVRRGPIELLREARALSHLDVAFKKLEEAVAAGDLLRPALRSHESFRQLV